MARRKTKANDAPVASLGMDKSWMAQDDLRTLSRAQEIQKDKARLAAARAEATKQMASLSSVAGGDRAARMKRLEGRKL